MKNQIKISIVFFFCVTVLFVVMLVKRDFQEPKKQEKFQKSMAFVFEHDENYSLSNWDISSLTG